MLLAFLALAGVTSWIPARWYSHDPASLDLLTKYTPVNCVLLEKADWSAPFNAAAAQRGIATLGIVHRSADALEEGRRAAAQGMTGVVLLGDFPDGAVAALEDSKILTIDLPSRSHLRLHQHPRVIGTYQGVWPGIQVQENGISVSGPSGSPWIDTNTGFLRFLRAIRSEPIWIANTPPEKMVITPQRYVQAVADAEAAGAHWVVALDSDFNKRLLAGDAKTLAGWREIGTVMRFYADHPQWSEMRAYSTLALVEDTNSALLSGGILDMLATKHTTVRAVASNQLTPATLNGEKMAADVDPAALTPEQRDLLKAWTRQGNTLLTAPPGWKMPVAKDASQITMTKDQMTRLDEIWKEMNSLTSNQNPGAKVFNAPSTISYAVEGAGGHPVVVHLVNYSDYALDSMTVRLVGKFQSAMLYAPGEPPKKADIYDAEGGGSEIFIEKLGTVGAIVVN
ncbi:MAG TPA: hypothetical protein VFA04_01270 [Bryobacteraceae bacterium]|nr:hypothetical protein [Bryobacteraceae bacterium]